MFLKKKDNGAVKNYGKEKKDLNIDNYYLRSIVSKQNSGFVYTVLFICERCERRSHFISRFSKIVREIVVL